MFCSKCGTQNTEGAKFCQNCGALLGQSTPTTPTLQVNAQQTVVVQHTSGLAIASLILGILGFSVFAIIFGAIAMNQIGKDQHLSGRGMALAGLILGIVWIVVELLFLILFIGGVTALSTYY
jgi:hypothetical protein